MTAAAELTGVSFGRWRVVRRVASCNQRATWLCRCVCGVEKTIPSYRLLSGDTKSCGCLSVEVATRRLTKHGALIGARAGAEVCSEYDVWAGMRDRCRNPHHQAFAHYGGRGIRVCARWDDFAAFLADAGPRPSPRHSLDRFPNRDGNYEPGNVRWATMREQQRNRVNNRRIEFNGETLCVAEWAERLGMVASTLADRLSSGWSVERAMTAPVRVVSQSYRAVRGESGGADG